MQNEEWIEMGKFLQEDFQRKQRRFWKKMTNKNKSRVDGTVFDKMVWGLLMRKGL